VSRAIWNVLVILVHRLLLSNNSLSPGPIASQAFASCWKSASEIAHILRVHEKLYKPCSETFSLCYAAYIGATIHVQNLAKHGDEFGALESLHTCLDCLNKHQALYSAARRARTIIAKIMEQKGVHICRCGGLVGQCHARHSTYLDHVAAKADQDLTHDIQANSNILDPISDLLKGGHLPFDLLNFNAEITSEDFRQFQESTGHGFKANGYPILYDLYQNRSLDNILAEPSSHAISTPSA
jgi:hypothetical protein